MLGGRVHFSMEGARAVATARRVVRRFRRRARKFLQRATGQRPPPRKPAKPPILTVVIATRNSAADLSTCLNSVLQQSLRRLEVLIVDDGSTDETPVLAAQLAAQDRRIRVLLQDRRGLGAARNRGAELARGRYLTFVDPQDTVPTSAFKLVSRTLNRSKSDFAFGAVQRVRVGRSTRPVWTTLVHDLDRIRTTIDQFPAAMQDVFAGSRVFRRRFWAEHVAPLEEDNEYGSSAAMVTAFIRARRFDVLQATTYRWHLRADPSSIVQERYDAGQLADHIAALKATWRVVSTEASDAVGAAWLGGLLDIQLGTHTEYASRADDVYRAHLRAAAATFCEAAGAEAWRHVRVDRKLRVWLAAEGRWPELEQVIEFFRLNGTIPPTRIVDGRVEAMIPLLDTWPDLPDFCRELAHSQTDLSACIAKADWQHSELVLEGWAFIRGVDLTGLTPELEAWLVHPRSRARVSVAVEHRVAPEANRWANQVNQNFETAGFRLRLDVAALPVPPGPRPYRQMWQLQLRCRARGVVREGLVRSLQRNGVAHRMPARDVDSPLDPIRYVPVLDPRRGLCLQVRADRVRASALAVATPGRVAGRLHVLDEGAAPLAVVQATSVAGRVEAPVLLGADGSLSFDLALPTGAPKPVAWAFRAVDERGNPHRVSWPDEASQGRAVGGGLGAARWQRSPRGFCDLITDYVAVQVLEIFVDSDTVTADVHMVGLSPEDLAGAALVGRRAQLPVRHVEWTAPSRARLVFALTFDNWGHPDCPLPAGNYRMVSGPDGLVFAPSEQLLITCPREGMTPSHGYTVARIPAQDQVVLTLRAPLHDDERGRMAQRRLADWYLTADHGVSDAVLFQCYRGEFATDSQRAIHEELTRRNSPRRLLWGVADYSVALPEGAEALLIGSRNWYAAVASSRYLCQNIDFDRFFHKRDHQRYLQTFHGYPFKSMGVSLWRAQGKSESIIDAECERRTTAWDSILVPSDFCVPMYRREYRYDGEVLVTGYPRNDGLVTPAAPSVRARVRELLQISEDKTVVLYAPTWRDTVPTGAWTAKLFNALDLDALTEQLGDRFVLLLRGHNYNLREGAAATSASVIDVSSYPEVNDLILAADVAVLDYSSLRFDWLLTDKPVVFFVPDLEDYLSARRALFDYEPTAPGPLLRSTEEVVAALRDLPAVDTEFAAARKIFNETFNQLHDGHAAERVVDGFFG